MKPFVLIIGAAGLMVAASIAAWPVPALAQASATSQTEQNAAVAEQVGARDARIALRRRIPG
jgi:hypothetical protein